MYYLFLFEAHKVTHTRNVNKQFLCLVFILQNSETVPYSCYITMNVKLSDADLLPMQHKNVFHKTESFYSVLHPL